MILCKFWLQVSDEEQLRRFKDREAVPYKQYKITAEDWRNRDKAPQYRIAVNDMVVYTSTESASWTLVEADDKPFARIKVLTTLRDALRDALKDGSFADPGGYLPCGKRPGNGSEAKGKTATGKPANGKGQKGATGDDSPEPTPTPPDSNGGGQAAKAKPGKKKSRSKG